MKQLPSFVIEKNLWNHGHVVIGIDEVGRGALAGPLTVGAVCFKPPWMNDTISALENAGINDSKVLTPLKRSTLADFIKKNSFAYATCSCTVEYINTKGIVRATMNLMEQVAVKICKALDQSISVSVIVDGAQRPRISHMQDHLIKNIIDGDAISISIAAASIIAKVDRDNQMKKLSESYPNYRWDRNKGYGTHHHREALKMYGSVPLHRTQFIRNIAV